MHGRKGIRPVLVKAIFRRCYCANYRKSDSTDRGETCQSALTGLLYTIKSYNYNILDYSTQSRWITIDGKKYLHASFTMYDFPLLDRLSEQCYQSKFAMNNVRTLHTAGHISYHVASVEAYERIHCPLIWPLAAGWLDSVMNCNHCKSEWFAMSFFLMWHSPWWRRRCVYPLSRLPLFEMQERTRQLWLAAALLLPVVAGELFS